METLVMVRSECCQTYKDTGVRCSICPNRPENKASVEKYRRELEETVWPGKDKPLKEAWAEIDDRIMDEHSLEGLQVRLRGNA